MLVYKLRKLTDQRFMGRFYGLPHSGNSVLKQPHVLEILCYSPHALRIRVQESPLSLRIPRCCMGADILWNLPLRDQNHKWKSIYLSLIFNCIFIYSGILQKFWTILFCFMVWHCHWLYFNVFCISEYLALSSWLHLTYYCWHPPVYFARVSFTHIWQEKRILYIQER